MNGNKKIAVFGTFDVNNYGDLLFPLLVQNRLIDYTLEFVSPTHNTTVFQDAKKVISFDDCFKKNYDAILIGGGNILHLKPNNMTVYDNRGFSYADLWIGAIKLAASLKTPSLFNAPGISQKFTDAAEINIVRDALNCANYISFREKYSKSIVKKLGLKRDIHVVPDTAFEISKMWPITTSEKDDIITINLNKRYHNPIDETAKWIDKIAGETKCIIKFLIIGGCHGDLEFTNQLSKKLTVNHKIHISNNLKELAHCIARSRMFIGSSMHGFITALSYNTPAFLVLEENPIHKFIGLFELCRLDKDSMCSSFHECFLNINKPAILSNEAQLNITSKLDAHWNKIIKIINSKDFTKATYNIDNYRSILSDNYNSKKNKKLDWHLKKFLKKILRFE